MAFIKSLVKNSIFKNLSYLVIGTIAAQIIIIGFQLVLRRIFSPADFGAYAVYMSIIGIIATISSFRYEQVIVLPSDEQKAYSLLWLSFLIAAGVSLLTGVFFVCFQQFGLRWFNFPLTYSNWLYFIPVSVMLLSVYQALNYYLIRLKQFKLSASNKVERRIAEGLTQTILVKTGVTSGLVWGDIVGQSVNALAAAVKIRPRVKKQKISFVGIKQVAKEYKSFPIQNGIPSFLNALSLLLPVIFINRFFDQQTTGLFDLARMILIMPLSLITASMSQVMLQRFSELRNQKRSVKSDSIKIAAALFLLAAIFVVVIFFFAPFLLSFIFGAEWHESGIYAKILVWAFALKFIVSPFNILFTVFEKIGWLSIWQVIYFGLIISLIFIPYNGFKGFLYFYVFFEVVSSVAAGLMSFRLIYRYEESLGAKEKSI
jgi:O-antigen/teichoic acid export membrane protein